MTEDATMVASGETPPPEDSQLGPLQLKQQPDQDKRTKGKIVQKKRGRGAAAVQEEVPLTAAQADHVRVVRADAKRDAAGDERAQPIVLLSKVGRAPQLQLSDDRLSVSGTKGYRTVRATHGAYQGGSWYCEVTITHLGASGHVRLGWCTNKAELQAPVGFDTFGFSYRDIDGSKVSDGLRLPYGKPFKEGDVVGLLIHMPDGGRPFEVLDRAIARYKGTLYLVAEPATEPQPLQGSAIAFTMNGALQGVAFSNVLEGTYYPAASLYTLPDQQKGAMVSFNFGPNFKYPLPQLEGCPPAQPCSSLPQANQPASVTPAVKAEVAADAPKDTPVQPMDTA